MSECGAAEERTADLKDFVLHEPGLQTSLCEDEQECLGLRQDDQRVFGVWSLEFGRDGGIRRASQGNIARSVLIAATRNARRGCPAAPSPVARHNQPHPLLCSLYLEMHLISPRHTQTKDALPRRFYISTWMILALGLGA